MQTVILEGKLPSLNEYVRACRANARYSNKLKRNVEEVLMWQMGRLRKIETPCFISFEWHEKNRRRDKDNVAFGKKFILDAMQKAEKLVNDGNNYIQGFSDRFVYGDWQGVILRIWEVGEDDRY